MRLLSKGPEETFTYGVRLGSLLRRGDVVCLYGELGSGKTVVTKGIASALGIQERDITSASFLIISEHRGMLHGNMVPFYHIDLYRIEKHVELDALGIESYMGHEGIAVVEWAERLGEPPDSISVRLTILDGEERELTIGGIHEEDWDHQQARQA
jgi:tRNA threonylcarbamoyladenosine biosynthesis protein TsaE